MKKNNAVISFENIIKAYQLDELRIEILHGITLSVYEGELVSIMGPSGSGKSTLLHIMGLLDRATSGTYLLHGNDVTTLKDDEQANVRSREIGFVFQSFNLLQRVSALENVSLPAIYAGVNQSTREAKAQELLVEVGLDQHIFKRPNQLSGGQQQRVAIARALMNNPSIILADEPTGNLDSQSGKDVMKLLKELHTLGKTVVIITHDHSIAKQTERMISIADGKVTK